MDSRDVIKRMIPGRLRSTLSQSRMELLRRMERRRLLSELRPLAGKRKILYAITPPGNLPNVGDHAQVIAIHKWLQAEFPSLPVVELNKDQVADHLDAVRPYIGSDDLIFLHSGGNMGDHGMWSEGVRRRIIETFPDVEIISLPQTIAWSDTPEGRRQLEISSRIYNAHPRLTIVARDPASYAVAQEHFSDCDLHVCPDFVLYLDDEVRFVVEGVQRVDRAVLCLRRDTKSILGQAERELIASSVAMAIVDHDTSVPEHITEDMRWDYLVEMLKLFAGSRLVVTDRFHGCIFAVLTRTPFIAIPNIDHKVSSGFEWFKEVEGCAFTNDLHCIESLARELAGTELSGVPDWSEMYFDPLAERLVSHPVGD